MTRARIIALAVLAAAAGLVAAVVTGNGPPYRIHARFADAGQLVNGGVVQIAGRKVGSISALRLSPDGQADVELTIDDRRYVPLTQGTQATIRAIGQAGVANRFVDVWPGPVGATKLPSGAVLPSSATHGIVDLDALFSSLGPRARADIRRLIGRSDKLFAGSGARAFNAMLARLDPALRSISGMTRDLAYDDRALATLVREGAVAAQAVASRSDDLRAAVANSAAAFGAIVAERRAVDGLLQRAPAALERGRRTLREAATTVTAIRPALRALPPAAHALQPVLARLDSSLGAARPAVAGLRSELPDVRRTLDGLVGLAAPAADGLRALGAAVAASQPIMRGLRIYGADFVLGVTNGLAGIITSNYNASGHYGRLNFVQNPQTLFAGNLSSLLNGLALPGLLRTRTGITALCPGGNEPPAPDGSNPWVPDRTLCDPSQSMPLSVNEP